MQNIITRSGLMAMALAALLGSTALAETIALKADANGQGQVPPNETKGTGKAEITYDTASKNLTWTVTFSGLTGDPTVAHFHGPAEPGKNAPVVVMIGMNPVSPAKGSATLTDAQAADLLAGRWYVNIHTAANRPGEIRGQVTK